MGARIPGPPAHHIVRCRRGWLLLLSGGRSLEECPRETTRLPRGNHEGAGYLTVGVSFHETDSHLVDLYAKGEPADELERSRASHFASSWAS